jgi:hypothetical protein
MSMERFCTHWCIETQSREKIDNVSRFRYSTPCPDGNNKRLFAASSEFIVNGRLIAKIPDFHTPNVPDVFGYTKDAFTPSISMYS